MRFALACLGIWVWGMVAFVAGYNTPDVIPSCANKAPEDVVVYRSEVPGQWDSCAAADDLVYGVGR